MEERRRVVRVAAHQQTGPFAGRRVDLLPGELRGPAAQRQRGRERAPGDSEVPGQGRSLARDGVHPGVEAAGEQAGGGAGDGRGGVEREGQLARARARHLV
jgi:hypothetical protein